MRSVPEVASSRLRSRLTRHLHTLTQNDFWSTAELRVAIIDAQRVISVNDLINDQSTKPNWTVFHSADELPPSI